jgi:hypothetical protein
MNKEKELDEYVLMKTVMTEFGLLNVLAVLMLTLIGIGIFQNVRANRLLRSIDRSLKMLPGVARNDRRAA